MSLKKPPAGGHRRKCDDANKQDITPLVLTNEARNLLSKDWNDFENDNPISITELAQYRLATLGYDIGSKFISGWGTSYTYPKWVVVNNGKNIYRKHCTSDGLTHRTAWYKRF